MESPVLVVARDALESLGGWFQRLGFAWSAALMLIVLVAKSGLEFESVNVRDAYLPAARALPRPAGYFSASLGNLALVRLLGVDTVSAWLALHTVLLVVAVVSCIWVVSRNPVWLPTNYAMLLVGALALSAGLTVSIGKYDVLTFFGGVLLVSVKRRSSAVVAAMVMALGNPEQAVVASLCLLILTLAPVAERWRRRAFLGLGVALVVWVLVQVWFLSSGQLGNRLTVIPRWFLKSLQARWTEGAFGLWSWYGVMWLIVLVVLVAWTGRARWAAAVALVALRGLVTTVTVDGARVFALCALPAALVAAAKVFQGARPASVDAAVGLLLVLFLICPVGS